MPAWLFWLLFTVGAVWFQYFLSGVDVMAAGLVVSLQEERPGRTFWLALAWTLIQEGMGSMAFGLVILLYASLVGFYFAGRWLFESRNFLFICLLGTALAVSHAGLVHVMALLQDATVPQGWVVSHALIHVVLFPAEWLVVSNLYRKKVAVKAHAI